MKYSNRILFIIGCLVIFKTSPVSAQSEKPLSLQEAIQLTLKNSHQLKANQAAITGATAAIREAEERRLPDFSVSASYLHLNNPNIDLKAKQSSSTGSGTPAAAPAKVSQAAYSLVNLSLPIYAGGRIKYGIESARLLAEATKLDADHDRQEVVQHVIDAYSNLYKAKASVELVNENLKQSKQRVADFSNLEKNGLLARNDLLKAQLQTSNIELTLLDAESNWKMANINMNLLTGLPESTILLPDSAGFKSNSDSRPLDEWEQLAIQNRKDLASLSVRKKATALGVKSAEAERYPSLALTGGYIAAHVPNLLTVTNAVNIGIGVQYNISSLWKSNSKIAQARSRIEQVEANEEMLNDAVRLQISQAYQQYQLTAKKIEVLDKTVQQANENYRITNNKYQNSLATTTDLLDADVAQLQARINYALGKIDAAVAYNKLQQQAGVLDVK